MSPYTQHQENHKTIAAQNAELKRNCSLVFDRHQVIEVPEKRGLLGKTPAHLRIVCASAQEAEAMGQTLRELLPHRYEIDVVTKKKDVLVRGVNNVNWLKRMQKQHPQSASPMPFSYDNLRKLQRGDYILEYDSDLTASIDKQFVMLKHNAQYDKNYYPLPPFDIVAKFHLSVNHEDLSRAWDAIAPLILSNHDLEIETKVLHLDLPPEALPSGPGKDIVLYVTRHNMDKTAEWQELLCSIKSKLEAEHIRPGTPVAGDHAMKNGGGFFFVREGDSEYDRNTGAVTNPYAARESFALAHLDLTTSPLITKHRDDVTNSRDTGQSPQL